MAAFLRKHLLSILILVIAVGSLVSCGTVKFYAQAAHGQWFLLHKARPIPDVLADAATGIKVKTKLKLVTAPRGLFGRRLGLFGSSAPAEMGAAAAISLLDAAEERALWSRFGL